MDKLYKNNLKNPKWKKIISLVLSLIIAFGTFITLTVGNFMLSDWIDFKSYITAQASTSTIRSYRYGNLVGFYNLNYADDTTIQYKIGDDGTWKNYVRPIAVEPFTTTKIYKRLGTDGAVTYSNITVDTLAMGQYTQAETDFSISNHGATFGYTRTYNSKDNSWFESIDSRVYLYSEGLARIYFPNGEKLFLPRISENVYKDEITGKVLTKDTENGYYIYEDDDYTYKFKIGTSETTYYLNKVCDKNGNTITISRSTSGITVSDGNGRSFVAPYITTANSADSMHTYTGRDINNNSITYTVKDHIFYEVKKSDNTIINNYSYSTDTAGRTMLTQTADKTIEYYPNGRLHKVTNLDGSYTTYGYNNAYRRVRTTPFGSGSAYVEYNNEFNPVSYKDEYGDVTTYEYYPNYRLKKEITDSEATTYTYSNGKIASETTVDNEDNTVISKTNYSNGLPVKEQYDDSYTYYTYDSNGNMLICAELKEDYEGTPPTSYNPDLTCFDATSYTNDNKGRVTKEEFSNGESNEYTYDNRGNVSTETVNAYEDEDSTELSTTVTTYTYDVFDNVLTTSTGNDSSSYVYDSEGRLLRSNENGSVTRSIYDSKGRLIQEIGPQDYDSSKDNIEANTYADANVGTRYEYNDKDQITREINRIGVETTYTYFETGEKQKEVFDIYEFEYNIAGLPVNIWVNKDDSTEPYAHYVYENDNVPMTLSEADTSSNATEDESTNSITSYDLVGKNTEIIYGNGQIVLYDYDSDGNLIKQKYKENENASAVVQNQYVYDNDNCLIKKIDFVNNQIYNYADDEENNSTTVSIYVLSYDEDGNAVNGDLIYSYQDTDVYDNEETEDVDESTTTHIDNVGAKTVSAVYASENDSFTTSNGTYTLSSTDDEDSSTTEMKDEDGNTIYSYTCNYSDEASASLSINSNDYSKNFAYTYDDEGRITSYGSGENDIEHYHYDEKGQLSRVDSKYNYETSTKAYTYDSRGNIRNVKDYDYTTGELDSDDLNSTETYRYDDTDPWPDKLAGAINGIDEIIYDANGNPIRLSDLTVSWSNGRQLTSFNDVDADGNEIPIVSYTYDDNGIRTSKTFDDKTYYYTNINGNVTLQYQLDANGNAIEIVQYIYDSANDIIGFTYQNQTYFYLKNLQNDIIAIVDENGNRKSSYHYGAWGDVSYESNYQLPFDDTVISPFGYRSYMFEYEIGAYYLQSRYYFAELSRFLNSDLPEYAQMQKDDYVGLNLFAYCCNDPVNNVDPSGYSKLSNLVNNSANLAGFVSGIASAIITLAVFVAKKTTFWNAVSKIATCISGISTGIAFLTAIKSARSYYRNNDKRYNTVKNYNVALLTINIIILIVGEILGGRVLGNNNNLAASLILATIGIRTISVFGVVINLVNILTKNSLVSYKSR